MATITPVAYNTGPAIIGTSQYGNLAVGDTPQDYGTQPGGVIFWATPDLDLYYVIAKSVPAGNQPNPLLIPAYVGFNASPISGGTEGFVNLANTVSGQNFTGGTQAKTWLESNGYWTSWVEGFIPSILMELDSTTGITSNIWSDISGNGRNGTLYNDYSTTTFNGNQVLALSGVTSFVIPISGFGTDMDTNGLTYEIWAYPTKTQNGTLIAEWSGFPPTGWNDAQIGFVSGKINGGVFPDSFSPDPYIQGPNFSVNTWYYIVLTYDVSDGNLKLYVNGSLISTTNGVKANPPSTTLTLGRPDTANSYLGGANGYFKGYIGQWRVWNGAISQAQVTNFFNTRKSLYGL